MQSQKRLALVVLFGLALVWAALPSGLASPQKKQAKQAQPSPLLLDCEVIDELDECIQARFSEIDGTFGIARVMLSPSNPHFRTFHPETNEERAAVAALKQAGWGVIFYLAGRQVLEPTREYPGPDGKIHRVTPFGVQGPLSIAPIKGRPFWPLSNQLANQLRAHAQKAFAVFAKQDSYDFSVENMAYTARPIRAQEACLKCHNDKPAEPKKIEDVKEPVKVIPLRREHLHAYSKTPLKVGDALGAAIYAYTKTKQ